MNMNKQNIKGIQNSYLVILVDKTNLIAYLYLSCKQMQIIGAHFFESPWNASVTYKLNPYLQDSTELHLFQEYIPQNLVSLQAVFLLPKAQAVKVLRSKQEIVWLHVFPRGRWPD